MVLSFSKGALCTVRAQKQECMASSQSAALVPKTIGVVERRFTRSPMSWWRLERRQSCCGCRWRLPSRKKRPPKAPLPLPRLPWRLPWLPQMSQLRPRLTRCTSPLAPLRKHRHAKPPARRSHLSPREASLTLRRTTTTRCRSCRHKHHCPGRCSGPSCGGSNRHCHTQADEEADSLMDELEEMGAFAEGAPGGSSFEPTDNSAPEDSAVHVHPLMTPGLAWMLPWKWKSHFPEKSSP
jgi:hypothetical protein